MVCGKYEYSIIVARRIYEEIKDDVQAVNVCRMHIEEYYRKKGITPEMSIEQSGLDTDYYYEGGGQSIKLGTISGKPESIVLMQNEEDTDSIIENAFYEKKCFGLPVFAITVMQGFPLAILNLMSRETYVSLDTPEEQEFRRKMGMWDDVIEKFGGNSEW